MKPFEKNKGRVSSIQFHPRKPWFFVATREYVRLYDLARLEFKRKFNTGSQWVSCMQVHPRGSNLFLGGLDRVFSWLDLEDRTAKPWKSLKHHDTAIRALSCHKRYPLLATVSDDATAIVYHAKVAHDRTTESNLLVPVKRLYGHKFTAEKELEASRSNNDGVEEDGNTPSSKSEIAQRLAILAVTFHPTRPWLLTAGADGNIGLFSY